MTLLERDAPSALLRWEARVICLLAWLAFVAIPLSLGEIGISWDALNHHIYLGWTAEHSRFDRDFLAASYQSFQFPYLYWPVYKLSASGLPGAWAGAVLATLHLLAVPPVWMMARVCIPGSHWFDLSMRVLAVVLAFLGGLVLSLFDSTSNDLLAAIPFVWAMAFALEGMDKQHKRKRPARQAVIWSGVLAGVSVACKLSNGPLTLLLPGLWLLSGSSVKASVENAILGGLATLGAFILVYGYWGWELWTHFGNPVYPFLDPWFAALRTAVGLQS